MTAAKVREIPGMVLTCGDCAGELIAKGATMAPVDELPYGKVCQIHPAGKSDMPATNALLPPEGWTGVVSVPDEKGSGVELGDPFPIPASMGPLTEITTRLVVAWSSADRTAADRNTVDAAVILAERILRATNGA